MMGHMFICVDRDRNYISFCEKIWKNRDKLVQIGQNDDIFVQIFGFNSIFNLLTKQCTKVLTNLCVLVQQQ